MTESMRFLGGAQVTRNILELGLKTFLGESAYVLRYITILKGARLGRSRALGSGTASGVPGLLGRRFLLLLHGVCHPGLLWCLRAAHAAPWQAASRS